MKNLSLTAMFAHRLRIFRWLLGVVILIILFSPALYWATGIGQSAADLSAEISRLPNGALTSSPKAQALQRLWLPIRIERLLIYPLLLLAFQWSGAAVALRRFLERRLRLRWPERLGRLKPARAFFERLPAADLAVILLFVLALNLAVVMLYLPFNFYRSFIIGHQFGLSTQSVESWLGDWSKAVGVRLLLEGSLWTGFYGLVRLMPRRWPIPGGALLVVTSLLLTVATPILITPLFYNVHTLDDARLRDRILALANRAGMPVDEVHVIDASSKTTAVNAYVAGFGRNQRITLYDTLLTGYTPDQVEVVLAHELGHWYYRHVLLSVLGMGAAGWLGLFGLRWLLERTWRGLGLRGPADVAGLPFVLAVVSLVTLLSLPVQSGISRYAERQADDFALAASQKPHAFIELFEQFAEQNLSIIDPPPWEVFLFSTHPPIIERIEKAENFQSVRQQTSRSDANDGS